MRRSATALLANPANEPTNASYDFVRVADRSQPDQSISPTTPKVGDTVTFSLTVSNAAGYADATGVSVQDLLPAGYGDVSEISDSGTLSGGTLTWLT